MDQRTNVVSTTGVWHIEFDEVARIASGGPLNFDTIAGEQLSDFWIISRRDASGLYNGAIHDSDMGTLLKFGTLT